MNPKAIYILKKKGRHFKSKFRKGWQVVSFHFQVPANNGLRKIGWIRKTKITRGEKIQHHTGSNYVGFLVTAHFLDGGD